MRGRIPRGLRRVGLAIVVVARRTFLFACHRRGRCRRDPPAAVIAVGVYISRLVPTDRGRIDDDLSGEVAVDAGRRTAGDGEYVSGRRTREGRRVSAVERSQMIEADDGIGSGVTRMAAGAVHSSLRSRRRVFHSQSRPARARRWQKVDIDGNTGGPSPCQSNIGDSRVAGHAFAGSTVGVVKWGSSDGPDRALPGMATHARGWVRAAVGVEHTYRSTRCRVAVGDGLRHPIGPAARGGRSRVAGSAIR